MNTDQIENKEKTTPNHLRATETAGQFKGDQKHLDHLLLPLEKKLLATLLPRIPSCLGTEQLTLMTLLWSAGAVISGYLAAGDFSWLWGVNICIALQHITDMLDGAVGRERNTGLIRWGFYADHLFDYIFVSAVVTGYSFVLPESHQVWSMLALVSCGGLMSHTFLDFAITNDYKISYGRIGISELRWLVILFNLLCLISGKVMFIRLFPCVVIAITSVFIAVVIRSQAHYRRMDRSGHNINNG